MCHFRRARSRLSRKLASRSSASTTPWPICRRRFPAGISMPFTPPPGHVGPICWSGFAPKAARQGSARSFIPACTTCCCHRIYSTTATEIISVLTARCGAWRPGEAQYANFSDWDIYRDVVQLRRPASAGADRPDDAVADPRRARKRLAPALAGGKRRELRHGRGLAGDPRRRGPCLRGARVRRQNRACNSC